MILSSQELAFLMKSVMAIHRTAEVDVPSTLNDNRWVHCRELGCNRRHHADCSDE